MSLARRPLWPFELVSTCCIVLAISGCGGTTDQTDRSTDDLAAPSASDTREPAASPAPAASEPIFVETTGPTPTFVRTDSATVNYPGNKPYIKRSVKIYSDDTLVSHGPYVSYHPNGQKFEEGEYVDGKKNGLWKEWWSNGKEAKTENYVDDLLDGQWTVFNRDGNRLRDVSYKAGQRDGKWTYYYDDGKVEREENYKDGKAHGSIVYYHRNGQKGTAMNWEEGRPEGIQQQWYENGQLAKQTEYKNGKLNGKATTWDDKGNKTEEVDYVDGNRVQQPETETAKAASDQPAAK